jgi:hypothetical protein
MPSGCYQYSSGGYSAAKLSALSQYENTSSRSERNVGGGTENMESGTTGTDFAYLEERK